MAPLQVTLLLLLSSLLQVSAYVSLGDQDDAVGAARGLPEDGGSQPASQGQWVWDTAEAGSADFPVFVRAKREAEVKSSNRSAAENTTAGRPEVFSMTPSQHPVEENEVSPRPEWLEENTSQENLYDDVTATAESLSAASSDNISTDAPSVRKLSPLDTSAKATPTQGSSNVSSEATFTGREEMLTGSRESREHRSTVEPLIHRGLRVSSPTSPPEPLAESSGVSTAAPVGGLATSRHGHSTLGKTNFGRWLCHRDSPRAEDTPSHQYPGGEVPAGPLLGAAVFIVCTAVLATLLWRQKHAYKKHQCNNTEMVCISALLPDSEPVANGEKPSKIKRMKLLTDNISETEGDNVTLSSWLPDH
uniref:Selectin P ligand n=1 Tax=Pelodiscus sinensis TaxID=13735 RepID=K7F0M9_PELSI|nr:P-selectin glycoprotein ligand 1 isoform X2 [Pelodiscus sinensis]XP_025046381.1 P-selectin glycoprotein ligand 1 isoform X2 [Pelodiscus sinensis]XP_025046384.1 P-selectin glycoprotein ligand 1 isoform X2 [Pelodiscus sinensis]XP_025046386.1 P-selectin glycoprotein ligand 1 isoform X2 [Pelodiscus sinensis]|eukprot:XP_006112660.1 P-selectin glycoprotein ligand 1 isoform X2 [Pelodiscus sinensis]